MLAYGWNFPDGLCGGPLAHTMGAPLLLTHFSQKYYAVAADYASGQQIRSGCVLGGDGLVGDDATRAIFSMEPQQTILTK